MEFAGQARDCNCKLDSSSHNVTVETARQDLLSLEQRQLLQRTKVGHAHAWIPHPELAARLEQRPDR